MRRYIITEGNKRYLIDNRRDLSIYTQIKKLEKKKLSKQDKELVKFIKTQLEKDWRKYLLIKLKKLNKR